MLKQLHYWLGRAPFQVIMKTQHLRLWKSELAQIPMFWNIDFIFQFDEWSIWNRWPWIRITQADNLFVVFCFVNKYSYTIFGGWGDAGCTLYKWDYSQVQNWGLCFRRHQMYQTHCDLIEGLHILRYLTKECFNISIFPLLLLLPLLSGQNICMIIAYIGIIFKGKWSKGIAPIDFGHTDIIGDHGNVSP